MATLHEKAQAERIVTLEAALATALAEREQPSFTAPDLAQREDEEVRELMRCVGKANKVLAFTFAAVIVVTGLQCLVVFAVFALAQS